MLRCIFHARVPNDINEWECRHGNACILIAASAPTRWTRSKRHLNLPRCRWPRAMRIQSAPKRSDALCMRLHDAKRMACVVWPTPRTLLALLGQERCAVSCTL